MKRILVIGAKGMLGRDLVEALPTSFYVNRRGPWEVVGWDLEEIDIQEEVDTVEKIKALHPEIVINLAAYTNVDDCEAHPEKAFSVNAEGMRHVARAGQQCGSKVVYLSTDYVFDGKKGKPYREDDPPHPLNVYGESKLKGEQYLQSLVQNGLIIRTQWLYGRHGRNFVTAILQQAKERKVLSIVEDQVGSPTYTTDLSKAIIALIESDARGIFHVANLDCCTWYAFGQAILRLAGMEGVKVISISSKELGRPAPRPSYSVLDTQKFQEKTGMSLRHWSEALKDFLSEVGFSSPISR